MISILTPTRQRSQRCFEFIKSIYTKTDQPQNIELLFYVDKDDPQLTHYKKLEKACHKNYPDFNNVKFIIQPPISVSKSWNIIAAQSKGDILIMGNDDLLYRTSHWDTILKQKIQNYYHKDEIYCAWFNDGLNGSKHCAFPILSRKWYKTVGYFSPGVFNFGYNDTWVFDIAKKIDRLLYIPEVLVEHMHFTIGKSDNDKTYQRNRIEERGNLYELDAEIFEQT